MVNEDEKLKLIASYIRLKTCFLLHRNFENIFYKTQNHVILEFQIPNRNIPNPPSSCLHFKFSVAGPSNLNCLHSKGRKKPVNSSIVD